MTRTGGACRWGHKRNGCPLLAIGLAFLMLVVTSGCSSGGSGGSTPPPTQSSVALSWVASTSQVSGYYVYRGAVSGGPYQKLNSSYVSATSYVDNGVASGQTYYYVVTAVDSQGDESAYSNEASATIP